MASSTLSVGLSGEHTSAVTADFNRVPRTYAGALHLLSLLPANRDVTALFEVQAGDDLNVVALAEVEAWLARAGYANLAKSPLAALRCVHVAGTKGKGSVCAFVTAMLVAERSKDANTGVGRVGTYLSPHVVTVRERIWLDGKPVAPALFVHYVFDLWARLSAADPDRTGVAAYNTAVNKPFFFRFLTLLALHVFASEGVQSAVIECGIGGAYDTTNVLPPVAVTAAAVTRLGIDHIAMLGHTLPEIAWHKGGIFKAGVAAFILGVDEDAADADDQLAALHVLRRRARERGASPIYELPAAHISNWAGVPDAALPGRFQRTNMALAAAVVRHHLRVISAHRATDAAELDLDLDPSHLTRGECAALASATLRARCEAIHDAASHTRWIVDGAHTAGSLAEVAAHFVRAGESEAFHDCCRILVFGVRDRQPGVLLRALLDAVAHSPFNEALFVFPPDAAESRTAALAALAEASPGTQAHMCDDAANAVALVRAQLTDKNIARVLATGSFVLAGDVLRALGADGDI